MAEPIKPINPTTKEDFVALAMDCLQSTLPAVLTKGVIYALLAIAASDD